MEPNGDITEAAKLNGGQPENEKKRQIDVPDEKEPSTKKARTGNADEVAVSTDAVETVEAEVKALAKGTAPVKQE